MGVARKQWSTGLFQSFTVYLSPRRHGRAALGAVMDTNAGRMRSAAEGEHRTGEECLDGISPALCDPAGERAIGARWNGPRAKRYRSRSVTHYAIVQAVWSLLLLAAKFRHTSSFIGQMCV
jgi:hypothetical protein